MRLATLRFDRVGAEFWALLPETPEEMTRGLAGSEPASMLFDLELVPPPGPGAPCFHVQGMRFPLDFVFLGPKGDVLDWQLDVPPGGAVIEFVDPRLRYVLELPAGAVRKARLERGDDARIDELFPGSSLTSR